MKRSFSALFAAAAMAVVLLPAPAQARLGETREQCVTRYGKLVKTASAYIPGSDAEVDLFEKANVLITVHYNEGKAWHIVYHRPGMNREERDVFLMANAPESDWKLREGDKIGDRTFWITKNAGIVAVSVVFGLDMRLEVCTAASLKGLEARREERIRQALRDNLNIKFQAPENAVTPDPKDKKTTPAQERLQGF